MPHAVIADDEYKGYSIPKGTMVLANIWYALRQRLARTNLVI